MKHILLTLLLLPCLCFGQKINNDLEIKRLTDKAYLYTAWAEIGSWGRVGCNGLIVIDNGKAFLVDTPMDDAQTKQLTDYIHTNLKAKVVSYAAGHWHEDCVGGIGYLHSQGVKSYANRLTNEILRSKQLSTAKNEFSDSLKLSLGKTPIEIYYLGGGHSTDNIVVWLPTEKVLFGGCMVKDCTATTLGNTADAAPLTEWKSTIEKLKTKFRTAQIIIPGHGTTGGKELLEQTNKIIISNL